MGIKKVFEERGLIGVFFMWVCPIHGHSFAKNDVCTVCFKKRSQ